MSATGMLSFLTQNSQGMVEFLILLALKASLLLAIAILCLRLLRKETASSRHLVCAFALGGLILLPALMLAMPSWRVDSDLLAHIGSATRRDGSSMIGASVTALWRPAVALLWLAGVAGCLLRSFVGWLLVRKELRGSTALDDEVWRTDLSALAKQFHVNSSAISLRIGRVTSTLTFGVLRPAILIPKAALQWNPFHRRAVLLHELAHIRRLDSLMQHVAQIACALFWFHPLVWVVAAQLYREQEMACDDAVLMAGVTASSYADVLLETARVLPSGFLFGCGFGGRGPATRLRGRFAHLLDSHCNRGTNVRLARWVGTAFALLLLLLSSMTPIKAETVYRIGGDISAPKLITHVEPEYTLDARNKRIQGTVLLSVIVGADGQARDIHVERSLDSGLDKNAVHTVGEWRFDPAMRHGKAVAVHANIEVNFRLQ